MGRMARTWTALATTVAACAVAVPAASAALPPVHNRHALEHAIHQKQRELARLQAKAHHFYELWLRILAHREQQKRNLLARVQTGATACASAEAHCNDVRAAHMDEEQERLSGEVQADESLASQPEPGESKWAKSVLARAHVIEEGIAQREAELAAALASPRPARVQGQHR